MSRRKRKQLTYEEDIYPGLPPPTEREQMLDAWELVAERMKIEPRGYPILDFGQRSAPKEAQADG